MCQSPSTLLDLTSEIAAKLWGKGGGTLGSDVTLHLVGVFVGAGLALIMVPINFWRNSDPFKKKLFLAQKWTELEHFS